MITFDKPATYGGVKICRVRENGAETDLEIRRYPGDRTWSVWLGLWSADGHREYRCLAVPTGKPHRAKREAQKWIEEWLRRHGEEHGKEA